MQADIFAVSTACCCAGWLTDEGWTQLLDAVNALFGKLMQAQGFPLTQIAT